MISLSRNDNSILSRWWWTIDRWMLATVMALFVLGLWLAITASPAVAERLHLDPMHFVKRQGLFLGVSVTVMLAISMMSTVTVRRMAVLAFPAALALLVITVFFGPEINGAKRWIPIGSFTVQPSEFLKPFFIVTSAWILSASFDGSKIPAKRISLGLYALIVALLVSQPDFGQTVLISGVWFAQMALAGLPVIWIGLSAGMGVVGVGFAYVFLPHVASRFDRFIDPQSGDNYQVNQALDAFQSGGILGKGPGEGLVKLDLPDAHTDYIFAVIGEEFGAVAGVMLLMLFAGLVVRGLAHLLEEENPFRLLAVAGLIMQFGFQALINIGVNLALLPSKGMTLPFVSYGGSSMLALAIGMGMVLALTRRNRFIKPQRDLLGWRAT